MSEKLMKKVERRTRNKQSNFACLFQAREASEKELRVRRKPTNFYIPEAHGKQGTRISKRFANKERARYFDAE